MQKVGAIAAIIGALILIGSFGMDTAPEGTHNIGLMQTQLMTFQFGGIICLIGSMAAIIGRAIKRDEP